VRIQGGNVKQILNPTELPLSSQRVVWKSKKKGFITQIDTEAIGHILIELGGGRKKASDTVDPRVGMIFHKKLGSRVSVGDPLVTVFVPKNKSGNDLEVISHLFQDAIQVKGTRKAVPRLISEQIR
jgi:thymidine phosphorylase